MQVAGESLLNDGTSVILFTLFFDMSRLRRGQYANALRLFRIMARFLIFSPCLGIVVGSVAVYWMMRSSHRHSKAGSLVQLCVTLIAAYLGFFLSDNTKIGQASGILTTVSAGLVLAYRVWPVVISKEALENVWSTLEHILNTLIFGLVGVQMSRGKLSHNVNWREIYWCIVLYLAVFVIRAVVVFLSVPILNVLGPHKVTKKESTFIVLGGLRGAVSLSLAIFVKQKRSNTQRTWPDDDDHDAERTLFLIGGVAFLTLLINAPIAHPVLKRFNLIAGRDEAKKPIVERARQRIMESAVQAYQETCIKLSHDAVDVTTLCRNLGCIKHATPVADAACATKDVTGNETTVLAKRARQSDVPAGYDLAYLEAIRNKLDQSPVQERMPVLRDTFLSIVHAHYWHMIDSGELPKSARATILLLRSIDIAKDTPDVELHDFNVLQRLINEINVSGQRERCFNAINQYTPTWFTLSSEIYYKLSYESYEVIYYVFRAYGIAHAHAQRIFIEALHGAGAEPCRPEEVVILIESARLVILAEERLNEISPKLKSIVKSKIVAERVMEAQRNTLHRLCHQGVLEEADADIISRELDEDDREILLARKEQTQAIAKFAVLRELPITANRSIEWDVDFEYGQPQPRPDDEGKETAADTEEVAFEPQPNPSLRGKRKFSSRNNLLESIEFIEAQVVSSRRGFDRDRSTLSMSDLDPKPSEDENDNHRYIG